MDAAGLETVGVTFAVLGWISGIVSCALPMWRVSAYVGPNIITAQTMLEGVWMGCVVRGTGGSMQCQVYESTLAMSADLRAARALTVISLLVGAVGVAVAVIGAKAKCLEDEAAKARVMTAAGVSLVVASLAQVIPVSWTAHTIVMEFDSLVTPKSQKREMGASLYLGWAAAALLLTGGCCVLCCSCLPLRKRCSQPARRVYEPTREGHLVATGEV